LPEEPELSELMPLRRSPTFSGDQSEDRHCQMLLVLLSECMTLEEQVDADLRTAMKARDKDKLSVLRMLKSALRSAAIDKGGQGASLDDDEAVTVIRKQVKQREDSITGYEKGGREDLADKEKAELAMLKVYLPEPLSPEQLEGEVKKAIEETGASGPKDMGQVMKLLQERVGDRADGKTLSQEVRRHLA
jgi:hypothetical protein